MNNLAIDLYSLNIYLINLYKLSINFKIFFFNFKNQSNIVIIFIYS